MIHARGWYLLFPFREGCRRGSITSSRDETVVAADVHLNRSTRYSPILHTVSPFEISTQSPTVFFSMDKVHQPRIVSLDSLEMELRYSASLSFTVTNCKRNENGKVNDTTNSDVDKVAISSSGVCAD